MKQDVPCYYYLKASWISYISFRQSRPKNFSKNKNDCSCDKRVSSSEVHNNPNVHVPQNRDSKCTKHRMPGVTPLVKHLP